ITRAEGLSRPGVHLAFLWRTGSALRPEAPQALPPTGPLRRPLRSPAGRTAERMSCTCHPLAEPREETARQVRRRTVPGSLNPREGQWCLANVNFISICSRIEICSWYL